MDFLLGQGLQSLYGISGKDKFTADGMPDDNQKVKFGSGADELKL